MTPTHRDEETMTDLARVTALCGAPFLSTREIQELRQIALDMSAELRRHRSASSPQETGSSSLVSRRAEELSTWLEGMDWPNDKDGHTASTARIEREFRAIRAETRMERAVFVRQWLEKHGQVAWKVEDLIAAMMPLPEPHKP